MSEQVWSVDWLQTNGVIYLPVVVKGATRVGENVRRGTRNKLDTMSNAAF